MLNAVSASASGSKSVKAQNEDNVEDEHAEFDEDDFECAPCEAGGTVEPKRHPGNPTNDEIEEHNLTHCPYRSWCPICVEAHGREDPHYRNTKEDILNGAPVISMDYKEISV